jgi:membrane-associated PAP2 superfamily phosphatase
VAAIQLLDIDWRLATHLYALEGGEWALRKAFVTENLIHKVGHDLSIAAWLGVLILAMNWLYCLISGRQLTKWQKEFCALDLNEQPNFGAAE